MTQSHSSSYFSTASPWGLWKDRIPSAHYESRFPIQREGNDQLRGGGKITFIISVRGPGWNSGALASAARHPHAPSWRGMIGFHRFSSILLLCLRALLAAHFPEENFFASNFRPRCLGGCCFLPRFSGFPASILFSGARLPLPYAFGSFFPLRGSWH